MLARQIFPARQNAGVSVGALPVIEPETSFSSGWVAAQVEDVLARGPFAGRARCLTLHDKAAPDRDFSVCIPVCNEEGLLPATLAALELAFAQVPHHPGAAVFVVNDTTDTSMAILADWVRRTGHHAVIAEIEFDRSIRCAPFARRLALDVGALLAADGALLTTDADTSVDPQWLAANLALLERQDALICGAVSLDPADLDLLPARVHECGALERRYECRLADLWRIWTGGAAYPLPVSALGASLAIRASCYRHIGGLPTPPSGEDKALARLVRDYGYPVIASDEARVVTSGRTRGRTAGGVSDALLDRMTSANPTCDDDLVPVAVLQRRADLWNKLTDRPGASGVFLRRCREDASLSTVRMRLHDVVRELAVAESLLAAASPVLAAEA